MKILKKNTKFIIGLLVGILISCSTVFASVVLAGQISYKPLNSLFRETTVEGAINSLYEYAEASASVAQRMSEPHIWTANEEIDFGNGLYGFKKTGTITSEASKRNTILILARSDIKKLYNSGGYFEMGDGQKLSIGQTYVTATGVGANGSIVKLTASGIALDTITNVERTNANYEVWVIYSK